MFEPIEKQGLFPNREGASLKKRLAAVVPYIAGLACLLASLLVQSPRALHFGLGIAAVVFMAVGAVFFVRLQRALKKYRLTGVIE
jgi:hypothetical protein